MGVSFKLSLIGLPRVMTADGREIPLKGAKTMGLLTILVMAEGRPITREWLQDRLWSASGPVHGRDSLKKAVANIRRTFQAEGADVIVTDGGPVAIDPKLITAETPSAEVLRSGLAGGTLLEGLDAIQDNEFRDWLGQARRDLAMRAARRDAGEHRQRLAIDSVRHPSGDDRSQIYGDLMLNRIAKLLRLDDAFDILDLRDAASAATYSALLSSRVIVQGDRIVFDLILRRMSDQRILLGKEILIDTAELLGEELRAWLVEMAWQITRALQRYLLPEDVPSMMASHRAIHGIEKLLRHRETGLASIESSFRSAIELNPRGVYYAWLAYLGAFSFEEMKGLNLSDMRDRTNQMAEKARELDPDNPQVRALLAHSYGFICKDFERAAEMLRPIMDAPGDSPIVLHSLALFHFYTGDFPSAKRTAELARRLGGNHPFSYAFDTTCAMIEFVAGNFEAAARYGESALQRQSFHTEKYEPSLRYLAASHAHLGNMDRGREIWRSLCAQSSAEQQIEAVASGAVAPQEMSRELLNKGFRLLSRN